MDKRKALPAAAILLILLPLSTLGIYQSGKRNLGSLRFWRAAHADPAGASSALPPDHPRSDLWQAALAVREKDWQRVLDAALPSALDGDPTAMQYAARAYEFTSEYDQAITLWRGAGNVEALMELGLTLQQAGRLEEAAAAYSAAWELDARPVTARLTSVLSDLGRLEEAERVYQAALDRVSRIDVRRPGWYRGLGRLYVQQDRWIEAVGAYEAALAAARFNPAFEVETVYFEIALSYKMAGMNADAVAAIETAVAMNPSAETYLRAGSIYEAAGNPEQALASYRLALNFDPDNKAALEAVERLEAGG